MKEKFPIVPKLQEIFPLNEGYMLKMQGQLLNRVRAMINQLRKPKMNEFNKELFKKLEDQCWETNGKGRTPYFNREKFAELIVRECIDHCGYLDGGECMFTRGLRRHWGINDE